jgi:type VI protein secretion system component Hcp
MENAMLENYSISGGAETRPSESFAVVFEKIGWEYVVEDAKGAKAGVIDASWDLSKQAPK